MTSTNLPFQPTADGSNAKGGYVYHDERITLAVNVALAAGRPLLITGEPGAGKSTLAPDVARRLGWAFVATTITTRTRLDDLTAKVDAVARLNDAQLGEVKPEQDYLVPGILWWAFDPAGAKRLTAARDDRVDPESYSAGTVVLLDEIDKAEPDLPNDLLEPLDRYTITVPGHGPVRAGKPILIVITSNGERSLPPAFLRRCIQLELLADSPQFFVAVAQSHFGSGAESLYRTVAERTLELRDRALRNRRRPPSMAEYLDTLKACLRYGARPPNADDPATDLWQAIEEAALRKAPRATGG